MAGLALRSTPARTPGKGRLEVCLATRHFYPVYVGPPLRFLRYAPGLRERGIDMSVFTQEVTEQTAQRDGLLDPAPLPHGMNVDRVPVPAGWRGNHAFYQKLRKHCASHPEIRTVQFLNVDLWSIPCMADLHRQGISTVFTYTLLSDLSEKNWKRSLQRLHRRLQLNQVRRIVVSSSVMRDKLEALRLSVPVSVIPNGVDLERFRPIENREARTGLRRKLGIAENARVILAIGPISPRKGTDVLVEAYSRLARRHPRSRLVLVGPRHDLGRPDLAHFRGRIQAAIERAGAGRQVIFTGPRTNVEDYLRAADMFVFPSHREGMPNVVPEAMGSCLPVILTPFSGLPAEFGVPGREFLLSDWAPATLAADIEQLLSCPAQRRVLGTSARSWAESNLDVNRSLDEYASLYRRSGPDARTTFSVGGME